MAREVLLRFRTKNYERAERIAKAISERAKRTLKTAQALSQGVRDSLEQAQRTAELRRRGAALGRRGAQAANRDLQASARARFEARVGGAQQAQERVEAVFNLGRSLREGGAQGVPALLNAAGQFLPGVGPFVALFAPITEKLLGHLEQRLQQELAKQEARLSARLEEERFLSNFTRRLQEDPRFQREQAQRAFEETLAEEARLGKRVERSVADLLWDLEL